MAPFDLVDRPCVVTGAGRGIGRALAEHLARAGAPVAICARTESEVTETAAFLEGLGSSPIFARPLDVTNVDAVRRFARDTQRALGVVFAIVNNAAVLGPVGRLDELDLTEWRDALITNVVGTATVTAAFVQQLASRGVGRVINISGGGVGGPSVAARISAYTSSKAAVAMLTETLAVELRAIGATVNAIAPGAQPTRFVQGIVHAGPARAGDDLYVATLRQRDSVASLEPFFALVDFVLSDEAEWLTGKLLSTRWDPVETLVERRPVIEGTSMLTMRRVDGDLYIERSGDKDRGA